MPDTVNETCLLPGPAPGALSGETVRVDLGDRSYDILIGAGSLAAIGSRINALAPGARVAVIADSTVAALHGEALAAGLGGIVTLTTVSVPPGESSKCFAELERVVGALLDARVERGDIVIAFGGGVVGDLAGFAAAILRRGVRFVQVPTSLLAQVDSSVGGKTGIDTRHGKNLVGAFHQPVLVVADTALLDTLSPREFRAGYAEIVKYGLIDDPTFFAWLEGSWREVFAGGPARIRAIATSCRAKARVVAADERETGERALLNLGHTFGHALEAATGFSDRLVHGEAVAIGMVLAFGFSAELGLCAAADEDRIVRHLSAVGLPTRPYHIKGGLPGAERLLTLIGQDKKVERGSLTFVLAQGIGRAFVRRDVPAELVRDFLARRLTEP
ncbi:3-dehydroquinate synthase [Tepidamorphus gemmatus]|uniref:3-dehydroquinate synthase n=1 Tax=Tepidamorphus gemmatus TaxID=747076 RepID=A0A4R3LYS3_9HYPH|nr:3-dehydroquinate synthase [Tepidamorphus gemmatus]TCT05874.1 3-dehydroquinate synthase [Tepidamorphus gemmatus]